MNSKLLNLQQENTRPQRNIEINDKIPDEKDHENKIDDQKYDERDQIWTIGKKIIIEDKETVQLKHLSTDIKKINRKEIYNVESDKSDTEDRDKIQISDKVIMIDRKNKMMMMIKLIKMLIKEREDIVHPSFTDQP